MAVQILMSKAVAFEINCSARKCKLIEGYIKDPVSGKDVDLTGVKISGKTGRVDYIYKCLNSIEGSQLKSTDKPEFEEDRE